ncbi:MAG: hypothetical protein H6656_10295 [Ardenticatenaceae bacterium]|nr:hypothetical protein [Ardenticatenaceae bacterium]
MNASSACPMNGTLSWRITFTSYDGLRISAGCTCPPMNWATRPTPAGLHITAARKSQERRILQFSVPFIQYLTR